uniref:Uncharacterized protein n=1 Tax=Rhizophagus irregularis (strain DAOM 181602 / DAOM 197198 / MUCL 43194) TaxID=747089 RepID=U9TZT2_RHIID
MNLFDEGEKNSKNSLITWNNNKRIVIFAKDKKKSQSKRYRRIGYHMIISNEEDDDSPYLVIVKGVREILYLVIWVLRDRDFNEIRFSAKFETTKEDEFKVLIRSLIIGNRKRIDEEYYLEMLMIEKFLQEEKMKLDIFEHPELKNEFIEEKMEKLLLTLKKENKSFSGSGTDNEKKRKKFLVKKLNVKKLNFIQYIA